MTEKSSQSPVDEFKDKVSELSREKRWSMFCYIPAVNIVTCALTSVLMVRSKMCRFHARQGFVLFALLFFTIFIAIISQTLSLMLWGVVLVLHVTGAVISFMGTSVPIPLMGQIAEKIPEFYVFQLLTGKSPDASVMGESKSK